MNPGNSHSLQDQWALVTGASKGIGHVVAVHLADNGVRVILTGRDETGLNRVAEEIRQQGQQAAVIAADLAQPEGVRALAQQALDLHTPIHILVNVAGVVFPAPALEQTVADWEATMAVNLRAPFLLSQALAPAMMAHGDGSIIMIGSAAGIVGFPDRAAYAASKGGLAMLTRQLAVEWGPYGLRVNLVAPTVTMTPMAEQAWSDPVRREAMQRKIPLGRFAQPEDIAQAVVYLASPAATMLNGITLPVDGGYTIQ